MIWTTETKQGDTWDMLALELYGSEMLSYVLLRSNPEHMRTIFLPSGLTVNVPQLPPGKTSSPLPPWARKG